MEIPVSPRFQPPTIVGIVNVTEDSFSDGGRYVDADAAVAHAMMVHAQGAGVIDVGAESTNPRSRSVPAAEQVSRLRPVIERLVAARVRISLDAYDPDVIAALLPLGISYVNDVTGLRDPRVRDVVRDHACKLVIMHAIGQRPDSGRAGTPEVDANGIMQRLREFFSSRIDELLRSGISRERLILDPGMGMFVGRDPAVSCTILREIDQLREFGLPLYVSTSRKSFIGQVLAAEPGAPRPVQERGAGTLATELWLALHGADYIRTHDVRGLSDGLRMLSAVLCT